MCIRDRVGDKYSSSVVNELYEGIKSNTTLDFKFYCYTEDTNGLNNNILTIPIKDPLKYKLQWHKLKYHDPKLTKISKGEDCIIMDIDMKIFHHLDFFCIYDFLKVVRLCQRPTKRRG